MNEGRKDRVSRIVDGKGGAWASTSQDYLHLCLQFIKESFEYCLKIQSNSSHYVYAIIPLLVSTIRSFFLEIEKMTGGFEASPDLEKMARSQNDLLTLWDILKMDESTRRDYELFQEIRNEIIHPAFFPPGTPDNCPEYLRDLKEKGLFTSKDSHNDYIFADQITSHKLCIWAFELVEQMAIKIILKNPHWSRLNYSYTQGFSKYKAYRIPEETGISAK